MTRDQALRLLQLNDPIDPRTVRAVVERRQADIMKRLSVTREAGDRQRILEHIDAINRAQQVPEATGPQTRGTPPVRPTHRSDSGNDPTVMLRTDERRRAAAAVPPLGAQQTTGTRMFAGHDVGAAVAPQAVSAPIPVRPDDTGPGAHHTGGFARGGQAPMSQPKEGDVLLERYELRRVVGRGGMGEVFAAWDRVRSEELAIKLMLPEVMAQPGFLERFLGEARLSSRLSHDNLIRVYDVQHVAGWFFLTMELLDGRPLRDILAERFATGEFFTVAEVERVLAPIVDGLSYLHRTSIHRDIKPENVFICRNGAVKLMDFGTAREVDADRMTQTGSVIGTVAYMAPEQWQTPESLDARLDQYAVAAMVYEMFVGAPPLMKREPLEVLRPDLPAHVRAAVDRALLTDRDRRFADCAGFLEAFRTPKVTAAPPAKPIRPATAEIAVDDTFADEPIKRGRGGLIAAVVLVLFAIAGAGAFFATRPPAELGEARSQAQAALDAMVAAGADGMPQLADAQAAFDAAKASEAPLAWDGAIAGYGEVVAAHDELAAWAAAQQAAVTEADAQLADAVQRWNGVVPLRPGLSALPARFDVATEPRTDLPWAELEAAAAVDRSTDAQRLGAMTEGVRVGVAVDDAARSAGALLAAAGVQAEQGAPVVQAVPERTQPVREEAVREEPVREEPVREEPVREEPVRTEPDPVIAEPEPEPAGESRSACLNRCDQERNAGGDVASWRRCRGACPRGDGPLEVDIWQARPTFCQVSPGRIP